MSTESFLRPHFAHRGLHDRSAGRIENSRAAFAAAIAGGYGIELDVQLASDGGAVVFHDGALDRLTDRPGRVAALSMAELGQIPLAGSDETIPALPDILGLVAGRVPLLIELKDQTGDLGPGDGRLEAAVARAVRDYAGPVALMSFNAFMVANLARLCPEVPRGLTTAAFAASDWPAVPEDRRAGLRQIDVRTVGASFISHDFRDLASPRVAELRGEGLAILTWTIRSAEEEWVARRIADAVTFEGYRPVLFDETPPGG